MAIPSNFTLPLRISQGLFALVDLVLLAYVAHWWTGHWHDWSPNEINFLLFTSVWTLISLAYLIIAPAHFPQAAHKFGILAAESLVMLFWFAGFIALATFLGNRVCFGTVCNIAKASVAFAAFEWFFFAATTGMAVLRVFRSHGTREPQHDSKVEMQQGA